MMFPGEKKWQKLVENEGGLKLKLNLAKRLMNLLLESMRLLYFHRGKYKLINTANFVVNVTWPRLQNYISQNAEVILSYCLNNAMFSTILLSTLDMGHFSKFVFFRMLSKTGREDLLVDGKSGDPRVYQVVVAI